MKKMWTFLALAGVLLTGIGASYGAVIGGPEVYPATGHVYYLLDAASWTDSEAQAIALDGHLATINDQDEQNWVFTTFFSDERNLWIGLNDAAEEGTFLWANGEPVTFTNWWVGEPNNLQGEDYVHMDGQNPARLGRWNDLHDWGRVGWTTPYGIVELVPEPATFLIDIKPGSLPNSINLKSKGVLPVAVLGSEDLDVSLIDPDTLTLEGVAPRVSGKSGHFWSLEDVNGDSILDLMLHFDLQGLTIDPESTELTLEGLLTDGTAFEGSDSIRIVPPMGAEVIPEPATLALLAIGGLALIRQRKTKNT